MWTIGILILTVTSLTASDLQAQAWDRTYGDTTSTETGVSTVALPSGGFLTIGRTGEDERSEILLLLLAADGTLLRARRVSESPGLVPVFGYTRDSVLNIVGTRVRPNSGPTLFTMSVDFDLEAIGPAYFPDTSLNFNASMARVARNGDILVCGSPGDLSATAVALRVTPDQRVLWYNRIPLTDIIDSLPVVWTTCVRELGDGRVIVAGYAAPEHPQSEESDYSTRPFAAILSSAGDTLLLRALVPSNEKSVLLEDVIELQDSSLLFVGATTWVLNYLGWGRVVPRAGLLMCTDATASSPMAVRTLVLDQGYHGFNRVERSIDGQIVGLATGGSMTQVGLEGYAFQNAPYLVSITEQCVIQGSQRSGKEGPDDYFGELRPLSDGGFAVTGYRSSLRGQYIGRRDYVAVVRTRSLRSSAPATGMSPFILDLW